MEKSMGVASWAPLVQPAVEPCAVHTPLGKCQVGNGSPSVPPQTDQLLSLAHPSHTTFLISTSQMACARCSGDVGAVRMASHWRYEHCSLSGPHQTVQIMHLCQCWACTCQVGSQSRMGCHGHFIFTPWMASAGGGVDANASLTIVQV